MNDHPVRCSGLGGQNMIHWVDNELLDNYAVTFESTDNRYAQFSKITYAVPGLGGTFIHVYAERAGADVSYDDEVKSIWRDKDPASATVIRADKPFDGSDQNLFSIEDFFSSVRNWKQPFADIGVGKTAAFQRYLDSRASRRPVGVTLSDM